MDVFELCVGGCVGVGVCARISLYQYVLDWNQTEEAC